MNLFKLAEKLVGTNKITQSTSNAVKACRTVRALTIKANETIVQHAESLEKQKQNELNHCGS